MTKADFLGPMLLLRTDKLPDATQWQYEVSMGTARSLSNPAAKSTSAPGTTRISTRATDIVKPLSAMPDETVIDEIVALEFGRPSFNAVQNYGSSQTPILYYVFDVLVIAGRDVMGEPLSRPRELLRTRVLSLLRDPIRESPVFEAGLADLIRSVKAQGLEGIVAKRVDSRYEQGSARAGSGLL